MPLHFDPTRTLTLRNAFSRAFAGRFRRLGAELSKLLVEEDAFGLKKRSFRTQVLTDEALGSLFASNTRWSFLDNPEKLKEFTEWLSEEVDRLIVPEDDRYWEDFITQGWIRGHSRAYEQVASVRGRSVFEAAFGGLKQQFLTTTLGRPETIEKVQILITGAKASITGMAEDLKNQVVRELAEGLTQGDNPKTIARRLNTRLNISKRRSKAIAQTNIIRAHAEGQLNSMEALGVEEVSAAVEWSTAGDNRVCPLCSPLSGVVRSIQKAKGLIPRHVNCRCTWIPANVGESQKTQLRSQAEIRRAFDASVGAERPKREKRTIAEQKLRSTWRGATRKPGRAPKPIIEPVES